MIWWLRCRRINSNSYTDEKRNYGIGCHGDFQLPIQLQIDFEFDLDFDLNFETDFELEVSLSLFLAGRDGRAWIEEGTSVRMPWPCEREGR